MTAIFVSPRAREHIRAIHTWWRQHRSAAPEMFAEELGSAFRLIAANPRSGPPHVAIADVPGVRRVLLRRSQYRLYYRFDPTRDRIEVLAVWHTSRGREPKLR